MVAQAAAASLVYATLGPDVVVLRWPEQQSERARLDRAGTARLLLVEPRVDPPAIESCIEDWLRAPADDADLRARLAALSARAARHCVLPSVDEHGQLTHRAGTVFLSPTEHGLADVFIEHFSHGVGDAELIARAWPDGSGTDQALRVQISRLRRRIQTIGLTIVSIRGFGYVMSNGS